MKSGFIELYHPSGCMPTNPVLDRCALLNTALLLAKRIARSSGKVVIIWHARRQVVLGWVDSVRTILY